MKQLCEALVVISIVACAMILIIYDKALEGICIAFLVLMVLSGGC